MTLMESKGNPCGKNVLDAPLLQKPFPYLSIRGVLSKAAKDWANMKTASECPWIKVSVCEILNLEKTFAFLILGRLLLVLINVNGQVSLMMTRHKDEIRRVAILNSPLFENSHFLKEKSCSFFKL